MNIARSGQDSGSELAEPAPSGARGWMLKAIAELSGQPTLVQVQQRLAELAATLVPCDGAAVWCQASNGLLQLQGVTEPDRERALKHAFSKPDNPVRECFVTGRTVSVPAVGAEQRWPDVAGPLGQLSVQSLVACFLGAGPREMGVLVLYSSRPGRFSDEDCRRVEEFCSLSAVVLDGALSRTRAEHLGTALESNRRIGIAIGVLMAHYGTTDRQAFESLRTTSQSLQRKLRDLAEEVILTGVLPRGLSDR